jgi:hypothetical protein
MWTRYRELTIYNHCGCPKTIIPSSNRETNLMSLIMSWLVGVGIFSPKTANRTEPSRTEMSVFSVFLVRLQFPVFLSSVFGFDFGFQTKPNQATDSTEVFATQQLDVHLAQLRLRPTKPTAHSLPSFCATRTGTSARPTPPTLPTGICDNPPRKIPYYRLNQSTLVIRQ